MKNFVNRFVCLSILASLLVTASVGYTEELFPSVGPVSNPATNMDAPKGLIIKQDLFGNELVFKTDAVDIQDNASAKAALEKAENPSNQVTDLRPYSELDKSSSTNSWYYHCWPRYQYNNYYYYSYSYQYTYSYYPYYGWNSGSNWYWYYRW